jgi:hypothetical protein
MLDYCLYVFDASRHRDLIPETVQDVEVVRKALDQLYGREDGPNPRFVRLGEYLGQESILDQFPVYDPRKGEEQKFVWREDPEDVLREWKGAVWQPECNDEESLGHFIGLLLKFSRHLGLDIYDAMVDIYVPANGVPLPREEGSCYRLGFDPDAASGKTSLPKLVKKATRTKGRKGEQNAPISWAIPPRFDYADVFRNGLARVMVGVYKEGGKFGYINEKGEEIVSLRFDDAEYFAANGLARVKANDKWGFINQRGEEIIPLRFDAVEDFAANGWAQVKANDKWGVINQKGEIVISLYFDELLGFAANGLAQAKIKNKWGFVNEKGEEIISPYFDVAWKFTANGLARVKLNGKYGYINENGEVVIAPRFDDANDFANGLAQVKLNGKYGYINERGEIVIPPHFDYAGDFNKDNGQLAYVIIDGKTGFINTRGEIVIPPRFNNMRGVVNGLIAVETRGFWGVINVKGEEVIPLRYGYVSTFAANGLAAVARNGKSGYINEKGEEVIPLCFLSAMDFSANGLAAVTTDDKKWGYIRFPLETSA